MGTVTAELPRSAAKFAPPANRARSSRRGGISDKIVLDPYRAFVFPNRIREHRKRLGFHKLMPLSNALPEIPYIRLSKIERGEVFARPDELVRIAEVLKIAPSELLIAVDQEGFDMATWAAPFMDARPWQEDEERFAVMLGAALRTLRNENGNLTIAVLDETYGLPAVILSRIENAQKTLDRWNAATVASLCRLFGADDEASLRRIVMQRYLRGELDGYVEHISDPAIRLARSRQRIDELATALNSSRPKVLPAQKPSPNGSRSGNASAADEGEEQASFIPPPFKQATTAPRLVPVYGAPLAGGLIAVTSTDIIVEAPSIAGSRAFGLRVGRATLGSGLPATAIVIVDPDRAPVAGGLAAIKLGEGYRLVSVTFDRNGTTMGYSLSPDQEINLNELDPSDVAAVVSAIYP